METTPWTENVQVEWPGTLSFFEHHIQLIRLIEASTDLHTWFVKEDGIGVRLGSAHNEVRVTSGGMDVVVFGGEDREDVERAVREVIRLIEPERISRYAVFTQHVVPLEGDYSAVCGSMARTRVGIRPDEVEIVDCGVTFDATTPRSTGQVQYGIVNADEIRTKLLPSSGGGRGRSMTVPQVAFWAESAWIIRPEALPTPIDVIDTWAATVQSASSLVDQIVATTATVPRAEDRRTTIS